MKIIAIGDKKAVELEDVGWCWLYGNYGDDQSFDYCLKVCNLEESLMLTEIYQIRNGINQPENKQNGILSGT